MKTARMIGNYAEHRAEQLGLTNESINEILHFTNEELSLFYKGRKLLTFNQLTDLASLLNVSTMDLMSGNEKEYSSSVVHCMNEFDNEANREKILDIIDDYLDIWDSLSLDQ